MLAIMLHNIPEGISIAVPIFYAKKSYKKAIFYVFIASIAEPIGSLIAYFFLTNITYNIFIGLLLPITAGIMIEIACFEFIPIIIKNKNIKNIIIYILGIITILLLNIVK